MGLILMVLVLLDAVEHILEVVARHGARRRVTMRHLQLTLILRSHMLLVLFKLHLFFPRKIGINCRLIRLDFVLGLEGICHLGQGLVRSALLVNLLLGRCLFRVLRLILRLKSHNMFPLVVQRSTLRLLIDFLIRRLLIFFLLRVLDRRSTATISLIHLCLHLHFRLILIVESGGL